MGEREAGAAGPSRRGCAPLAKGKILRQLRTKNGHDPRPPAGTGPRRARSRLCPLVQGTKGGARLGPGTKRARGSEGRRGRARGAAPSSGSTSPPCGRPGPALPGAGGPARLSGHGGAAPGAGPVGGGATLTRSPSLFALAAQRRAQARPPCAHRGVPGHRCAPPGPTLVPTGERPPPCTLTGAHALVHKHRRARPSGARTALHTHPRSAPPAPQLCPGCRGGSAALPEPPHRTWLRRKRRKTKPTHGQGSAPASPAAGHGPGPSGVLGAGTPRPGPGPAPSAPCFGEGEPRAHGTVPTPLPTPTPLDVPIEKYLYRYVGSV